MRGADALVHGLAASGVETVFALSGNQIMPVFDAILDSDLELIHTRHEAGAVFMAEACAQLTDHVGVALVTAGGGLGNASGALIAAQASDTPVLLLSGDSPVSADGRGAFQEMDQTGMTQGLTKASWRVMRSDDMAETLNRAIELAQTGRPGPVHLALPADVLTDDTSVATASPRQEREDAITLSGMKALADMAAFGTARRPLVILGPALNETRAPGLAHALQDKLQAPVVAMESPRGLNDPALGRLADVAKATDHVLAIGKSIDFTLRFGGEQAWPNAAHWDVVLGDETQLASARGNLGDRLQTALHADPRAFARHLSKHAPEQPARIEWLSKAAHHISARVEGPSSDGIFPTDICQAVQAFLEGSDPAILICDGGEFGQWSQACLNAPRRVINGVSGIIGGGIGYAIGAKAADPDATIVALMGDGTFGFHMAEFETAARAGLPFIAVVGNDRRWNAEHLIQTKSFGDDRHIGCDLGGARYDLAAAALGGFGAYVTGKDQLAHALLEAAQSGLPACVNVKMEGLPAPTF